MLYSLIFFLDMCFYQNFLKIHLHNAINKSDSEFMVHVLTLYHGDNNKKETVMRLHRGEGVPECCFKTDPPF